MLVVLRGIGCALCGVEHFGGERCAGAEHVIDKQKLNGVWRG